MLPPRKLRLLPDNAVPELKWGMRLRRSPARSDPIPECLIQSPNLHPVLIRMVLSHSDHQRELFQL
jgi:hypothetical protein